MTRSIRIAEQHRQAANTASSVTPCAPGQRQRWFADRGSIRVALEVAAYSLPSAALSHH
jgi:hypothetical protein